MVWVKVGTVIRWHAQDEVNQEESEQNEVNEIKKGADSTGNVMHNWKSGWWFVMEKYRWPSRVNNGWAWLLHDTDRTEIGLCIVIRLAGSEDFIGEWYSTRSFILNQCRDCSSKSCSSQVWNGQQKQRWYFISFLFYVLFRIKVRTDTTDMKTAGLRKWWLLIGVGIRHKISFRAV